MSVQQSSGKPPEKKFRAGAISATVWRNEQSNDAGPYVFHTVTLERGYKDKEGNWKNTHTLRTSDLPRAALVLNKAYEYLVLSNQKTQESPLVTEETISSEVSQ